MSELIVSNVMKSLGGLPVLRGATFTADKGRILALLGASGSGKTTLLRCIAGLEQPEEGEIRISGRTVLDSAKAIALAPEQREIGLVFQSYALWPHRTVAQNVGYGLKLRNVPPEQIEARVRAILEKLGLAHLAERYPDQLSGGQQQRVAICRALVYEPKVLLLDEPLSNLDAKLREEARFWIRKLILELGTCAIMVTHDQGEALAMADHILLLKDGVIMQQGTPIDIYSNPHTFYSAEFLGTNNVSKGKVAAINGDGLTVQGEGWDMQGVWRGTGTPAVGRPVRVVVRVERVALASANGTASFEMDHDASLYLGDKWEHRMRRGDLRMRAYGTSRLDGGKVRLDIQPRDVWVFEDA
ncbi:MAG TPA: ABC transporter ATP-binding protein [Burkholderiales bacterium]